MTRNFQGAEDQSPNGEGVASLLPGNRIQLHDWQGERRDGGSNPPWSVFLRLQKWMDQGEKPPMTTANWSSAKIRSTPAKIRSTPAKIRQWPPKYGQWPPKYGQPTCEQQISMKFVKRIPNACVMHSFNITCPQYRHHK